MVAACLLAAVPAGRAGSFAPAAGQPGTTAVSMNSPDFVGWATGVASVTYGANVDKQWRTPDKALGPASGTSYDVVSLGDGGSITLSFSPAIKNGPGWDLAVFENSFSDTFLELGYVEVSSDGVNFIRFPNRSLTPGPVGSYGQVDPTDIDGLAGKYRQGYGAPFDLSDLALFPEVLAGVVNLSSIRYVRIVDVLGDGSARDSTGAVIYDPYPSSGSAGFDLDAIGVRYQADGAAAANPPAKPAALFPADGATNVALSPVLTSSAFSDPDPGDIHLLSTWQVSTAADFSTLVLDRSSGAALTAFPVPGLVLSPGQGYYWRVRHYDGAAHASDFSDPAAFVTAADALDANHNGVPDVQETAYDWDGDGLADPGVTSVTGVSSQGAPLVLGLAPGGNAASIEAVQSLDPAGLSPLPGNMGSGVLGFRLRPADPAAFVTVVIRLSAPAPAGSKWYMYDPSEGWSEYGHAVFGADGKSVTLTLSDGVPGYGDTDGTTNGVIVDPGGPVYPASVTVPASGAKGIGGSGGCFIDSIFFRL